MRREVSLIAGIIAGVGIGILGIGFMRGGDSPRISEGLDQTGSTTTLGVDAPAPDFELVSLSGEQIQLEDYRGQVVLLNFWATWCGPCRLEMPAFQDRFEQYGGGLQVVAVNFDESAEDVQSFVDELGMTFDVLLDLGAEVQKLYQVRGYPTSYFIDADGIVRVVHIGLMTEGQLDDYLADLGLGG
ncbi:MAG: redoxin domain-containing protein [Anaerolineales bacterium]|nr:redoxin domain-containing protein [Chloroflexota bacterium]MBL7161778.1 redoxin domain-containing protein [Anaerolineales bacterium]